MGGWSATFADVQVTERWDCNQIVSNKEKMNRPAFTFLNQDTRKEVSEFKMVGGWQFHASESLRDFLPYQLVCFF